MLFNDVYDHCAKYKVKPWYEKTNKCLVKMAKYDNTNCKGDYRIKIYYEWCHNKPIDVGVINKYFIETELLKYKWVLDKHIDLSSNSNYNSILTPWEQYFNCFSILVFYKN